MDLFPGAVPDYVKHGADGLLSKCPSAPAHSGDSEPLPHAFTVPYTVRASILTTYCSDDRLT